MEYKFRKRGSLYLFEFDDINITVRKIRESSDGMRAEVELWLMEEDKRKTILNQHLNLLAIRSRNELAKELNEIKQNDYWYNIIKTTCEKTIGEYRKGEQPKRLSGTDEGETVGFLAEPFIYENKANMIYGAGSSLKSYFALMLGMLIQNPPVENSLGLKFKQANTLYLDYEGEEKEINKRIRTVQNCFDMPRESNILYRESRTPFIDELDEIEIIVDKHDIKFLIIDSLGIACASRDLKEIESANSLYLALRKLNLTSLLITHVTKEVMQRGGKHSTPYGSVFFFNFARNIREAKKAQDEDSPTAHIGLFHRKNNQGNLFKPICFELNFNESLTINPANIEDVPEFNEELPYRQRIYQYLRKGAATIREMAIDLRISQPTIRATLNNNPHLFVKLDKKWGILMKSAT